MAIGLFQLSVVRCARRCLAGSSSHGTPVHFSLGSRKAHHAAHTGYGHFLYCCNYWYMYFYPDLFFAYVILFVHAATVYSGLILGHGICFTIFDVCFSLCFFLLCNVYCVLRLVLATQRRCGPSAHVRGGVLSNACSIFIFIIFHGEEEEVVWSCWLCS